MKIVTISLLLLVASCTETPESVSLPPAPDDEGEACATSEDCDELCTPAGTCASFWGQRYWVGVASIRIPSDAMLDEDGSGPDVNCSYRDMAGGGETGVFESGQADEYEATFESREILELVPGILLKFHCYDIDPDDPGADVKTIGEFCWGDLDSCESVPEEVLESGETTVELVGGPIDGAMATLSFEPVNEDEL